MKFALIGVAFIVILLERADVEGARPTTKATTKATTKRPTTTTTKPPLRCLDNTFTLDPALGVCYKIVLNGSSWSSANASASSSGGNLVIMSNSSSVSSNSSFAAMTGQGVIRIASSQTGIVWVGGSYQSSSSSSSSSNSNGTSFTSTSKSVTSNSTSGWFWPDKTPIDPSLWCQGFPKSNAGNCTPFLSGAGCLINMNCITVLPSIVVTSSSSVSNSG